MIYTIKVTRSVLREDASPLPVVTARAVYDYAMRNCYKDEDMWKEVPWMLVLDKNCSVVSQYKVSEGSQDQCIIDKKVVARVALQFLASGVIIAHNHPSGNSLPSQADIRQTADLKKALDLFDIPLIDHVIVGEGEFYSFTEEHKTTIK